jgi:glutathione S-transferase
LFSRFSISRPPLFTHFSKPVTRKGNKRGLEVLKILEEKALGDKKSFRGQSIGMVDIAYGWLAYRFSGMEEAVGVKVVYPSAFPRLHAWIQVFKEVPVIKDNLPDYGKKCWPI